VRLLDLRISRFRRRVARPGIPPRLRENPLPHPRIDRPGQHRIQQRPRIGLRQPPTASPGSPASSPPAARVPNTSPTESAPSRRATNASTCARGVLHTNANLRGVGFLGSAGLGTLAGQPQAAARPRRVIHACGPPGQDLEHLQVTRAISVRPSVLDASAADAHRQAAGAGHGRSSRDGAGNTVFCEATLTTPSRHVATPVLISGVASPARPARRAFLAGRNPQ
jgi:hypothetical protein